jgi:hypothetical protein
VRLRQTRARLDLFALIAEEARAQAFNYRSAESWAWAPIPPDLAGADGLAADAAP